MKKVLLIFTFIVSAIAAKAVTATVYVKADKAPYIYAWYNKNQKDIELVGKWPGTLCTETVDVAMASNPDSVITFWKMQISTPATVPAFHIIFNDGGPKGDGVSAKQTRNISNITTDRYFTYDGKTTYVDISDDMGVVVPDAEITSVALLSSVYNNWDVNSKFFTEMEKNKTYQTVVDLTNVDLTEDEECFFFELFINGSEYLGFSNLVLNDPNEWIEEDKGNSGDNLLIDIEEAGTRVFLFTASWVQCKYISDNWTLRVEQGTSGIYGIPYDPTQPRPRYNLSGQQVRSDYRGLVITNGKKLIQR